jgi:hypothetical protein
MTSVHVTTAAEKLDASASNGGDMPFSGSTQPIGTWLVAVWREVVRNGWAKERGDDR